MNKISIVITYCSLDKRFIETNILQSLKITDDVVVSTYDHLFNGEPEDLTLIYQLKNKYPMVKFIISEWTPFIDNVRYWHNMGRMLGYEKTNKEYKWLIFLDGDEILNSHYFNLLLEDPNLNNYDAYIMATNWFFREPIYRSTTTEINIPFYKKSIVSINPFNPLEERGQICRNAKDKLFSGLTYNGNVLVDHYSWVRTREECIKKVQSWGHKNDKDWVSLINQEFDKPEFDGTDFVHGYKYDIVEDVYNLGVVTPIHNNIGKPMKKISICMTHYNRKKQLLNTLSSIEAHGNDKNLFDIIIVDDVSDGQDILTYDDFKSFDLDIKLISITTKNKWWVNPGLAFNTAFNFIDSEITIIQNAECLHVTNVIDYVLRNLKQGEYIAIPTLALSQKSSEKITLVEGDVFSKIQSIDIEGSTWYCHSIKRNDPFNFCSAIHTKDLKQVGGFDDRFYKGLMYDDDALLGGLKRLDMTIRIEDSQLVYHQWHPVFWDLVSNREDKIKTNKQMYWLIDDKYSGNENEYTDWIPHVKNTIPNMGDLNILEFGIGKGTLWLCDNFKSTYSFELIDRLETELPKWFEDVKYEITKRGKDWGGELVFWDELSFVNFDPNISPYLKDKIDSIFSNKKIDVVFMDGGYHVRGDIVNYVINTHFPKYIIIHDTVLNYVVDGYHRIHTPESYEIYRYDIGLGTHIYKKKDM